MFPQTLLIQKLWLSLSSFWWQIDPLKALKLHSVLKPKLEKHSYPEATNFKKIIIIRNNNNIIIIILPGLAWTRFDSAVPWCPEEVHFCFQTSTHKQEWGKRTCCALLSLFRRQDNDAERVRRHSPLLLFPLQSHHRHKWISSCTGGERVQQSQPVFTRLILSAKPTTNISNPLVCAWGFPRRLNQQLFLVDKAACSKRAGRLKIFSLHHFPLSPALAVSHLPGKETRAELKRFPSGTSFQEATFSPKAMENLVLGH